MCDTVDIGDGKKAVDQLDLFFRNVDQSVGHEQNVLKQKKPDIV